MIFFKSGAIKRLLPLFDRVIVERFAKETTTKEAGIQGYAGSEKSIFAPSGNVLAQQQAVQKSGTGKLILMIIGILAGIVGLGLLGYYVIFPLIFK